MEKALCTGGLGGRENSTASAKSEPSPEGLWEAKGRALGSTVCKKKSYLLES